MVTSSVSPSRLGPGHRRAAAPGRSGGGRLTDGRRVTSGGVAVTGYDGTSASVGPKCPPEHPDPFVTVVVVTWQGRHLLGPCLGLPARQTRPHRLVVVDNASTDGTPEFLATEHPEATVVRTAANLGFAGGVQAGLDVVDTPYAALLEQRRRGRTVMAQAPRRPPRRPSRGRAVILRMVLSDRPARLNNTGVRLLCRRPRRRPGPRRARGTYAEAEEVFGLQRWCRRTPHLRRPRSSAGFPARSSCTTRTRTCRGGSGWPAGPLRYEPARRRPAPPLRDGRPAVRGLRLPQSAQPPADAGPVRAGAFAAEAVLRFLLTTASLAAGRVDRPAVPGRRDLPAAGPAARVRVLPPPGALGPALPPPHPTGATRSRDRSPTRGSARAADAQPGRRRRPSGAAAGGRPARHRPRAARHPSGGKRRPPPPARRPSSSRSPAPSIRSGARRGAAQNSTSGAATPSQVRPPASARAAAAAALGAPGRRAGGQGGGESVDVTLPDELPRAGTGDQVAELVTGGSDHGQTGPEVVHQPGPEGELRLQMSPVSADADGGRTQPAGRGRRAAPSPCGSARRGRAGRRRQRVCPCDRVRAHPALRGVPRAQEEQPQAGAVARPAGRPPGSPSPGRTSRRCRRPRSPPRRPDRSPAPRRRRAAVAGPGRRPRRLRTARSRPGRTGPGPGRRRPG